MIIFNKNTNNLPMRWIILGLFALTIFLLIMYLFYWSTSATKNFDSNLLSIFGGLTAGFIIAFTQFLLSWYEHKNYDKFKKLGVIDILSNKYNEQAYSEIIDNTKEKLWVMGNTALDFLNHFADQETSVDAKRVLLKILHQGVDVKILIAQKRHHHKESVQQNHDMALPKLELLKQQYPNFKFEFYDHIPTHSIFIFDNECFIGPIFPDVRGRETPAIKMLTSSLFAKTYLEYFEKEWQLANANQS
jgi:hypothetical protein